MIDVDDFARGFAASGNKGVPAYARIKRVAIDRIRHGDWGEGDQLPSENQLVVALDVSRMTINRALRELSADGYIVRRMGIGSFVAPVKAASSLFEVRNIADEVQRRGHRHRMRVVLLQSEDHADRPFAGGSTSGRVHHSVIVHYEDDTPIQVEDRLVDPALVPEYLDQDFTATTPNDYLSRAAPFERGEHIIEAVLPTAAEADLLDVEVSEPCLLIRRRTWSADGLVSIARLIQPGSRSRLEGTFGRGPME
jgi:GntR family histidine utilization transcriptional repressor